MQLRKEQLQNYFTLIGALGTIDITDGTTQAGVPYIRGIITVKADESEFKVNFFEMKKWKVGKPDERPNPRFEEVKELVAGQIVRFSCALEENKFAGSDGNIISNEQLTLNFINKPNQGDEQGLTFDMVGVVLKPLQDKVDDKGNLVKHTIKLGQGQYRANQGFSIVELAVDKNQSGAVNFIRENYKVGDTVRVSGHGKAVIETSQKTTESLFGEAKVETFQNYSTDYFIDSGLQANDSNKYSEADIAFLTEATKTYEEELKSKAKSKPKTGGAAATFTSTPSGNSDGGIGGLLGL